jgi:hypothetical protein
VLVWDGRRTQRAPDGQVVGGRVGFVGHHEWRGVFLEPANLRRCKVVKTMRPPFGGNTGSVDWRLVRARAREVSLDRPESESECCEERLHWLVADGSLHELLPARLWRCRVCERFSTELWVPPTWGNKVAETVMRLRARLDEAIADAYATGSTTD